MDVGLIINFVHDFDESPILIVLLSTFVLIVILRVFVLMIRFIMYIRQPMVCLELLTLRPNGGVHPDMTGLYTALHSTSKQKGLFKIRPRYSLELYSSRADGIKYRVICQNSDVGFITNLIHTILKDVEIKEVQLDIKGGRVLSYRTAKHYAFPLRADTTSNSINAIATALTQLRGHESITIQYVITPTFRKDAEILHKRIMRNEDVLSIVDKQQPGSVDRLPLTSFLLKRMDELFSFGRYNGPQTSVYTHYAQVNEGIKPARQLSQTESNLLQSIDTKVTQPLFSVNIRVRVATDRKSLPSRSRILDSAFSRLSSAQYQQLCRVRSDLLQSISHFAFNSRLPSLLAGHSSLLAPDELSSLYQVVSPESSDVENMSVSLTKYLPAPTQMKNGRKFDVILGENVYHEQSTPIGLTAAERERHMYMLGATGNGKTTILKSMIIQDIKSGKGVAVIDPHGDMASELLSFIPKERVNDVIYFNPDDLDRPIGLNLLELDPSLEGNDLLREKDLIVEAVVSIFRKIFSEDDSGGHRVEYFLRNAAHTALTIKDATLFTMYDLINNPMFRKKAIKDIQDVKLKDFWKNEFGEAGKFQKVKMAAGITAKLGRFLFSAPARSVLEQSKSTIYFEQILDEGKILICNFSKGMIGEDTSELFGTLVLAKIQLAALKRARQVENNRRPFYIYVDEFQNFATQSFVQILSEARKYKLYITMAEQSTSQHSNHNMVDIILANTGTVLTFRSANLNDELVLRPMFQPYLDGSEISHLPSFNFYLRIAGVEPMPPISGITSHAAITKISDHMTIQKISANIYGRKKKLETHIVQSHLKREFEDYKALPD